MNTLKNLPDELQMIIKEFVPKPVHPTTKAIKACLQTPYMEADNYMSVHGILIHHFNLITSTAIKSVKMTYQRNILKEEIINRTIEIEEYGLGEYFDDYEFNEINDNELYYCEREIIESSDSDSDDEEIIYNFPPMVYDGGNEPVIFSSDDETESDDE